MHGKTHLLNDLLCVEWDVKPYTLTHSLLLLSMFLISQVHLHPPSQISQGACVVLEMSGLVLVLGHGALGFGLEW